MTEPATHPDSDAPFGTTPRRGSGPLIVLAVLYVGWVGTLIWMATSQV